MLRLCIDLATKPMLPAEEVEGLNRKTRRDLGSRLPWLFDNGLLPNDLRDLAKCPLAVIGLLWPDARVNCLGDNARERYRKKIRRHGKKFCNPARPFSSGSPGIAHPCGTDVGVRVLA